MMRKRTKKLKSERGNEINKEERKRERVLEFDDECERDDGCDVGTCH